ncbi:ABC1 kinase family protein [Nocardia goodfellowii]|uniref:Unusual protein kinase regulating ubiquinone biosynthesis (AarF/ABC1/UbiB family) n=1 Tax=Nocardia goodfellowii TaxID=882446 RepID=A0ABS4Q9F8_9NOCA|nr:AarF/ABC1/UbiB kinase family protein [Nocardia goodfellowii]MBP2188325.1 putative unusual protein kinase regulating ubiquinone biosynthesis (AarF/ABC1/UbiB family) [Nocardia goodfellowii]
MRNAKLAALPVAYAGRQAAGVGKRVLGRSSSEINRDIQLRTAQHIFEVLGELKGCAAKLGQLLAIYGLALPREVAEPYTVALSQLQDSAPAMLPSMVHAAMAESLGADWRWHFQEFDDRRAAAASIGQVHRAVWHDGRRVAVKIMYPGARAAIEGDLAQLRRISLLATVFLSGADVKGVTEAISDGLRAELDYAAEAEHQRAFAAAYADDPEFYIPNVVAQHGDVLITEWLDGTPLTRVVANGSRDERNRLGMLMLRFVLSGWARDGLLYADPHPGNFQVLADGRLGIVDFGACCPWPPEGFDELALDYCTAISTGGPKDLESAARRHGFVESSRDFDIDALFKTVMSASEPFRRSSYRLTTPWLRTQVLRTTKLQLTNVTRQLTMPAYFTPFARSALTLIGTLSQLETEGPYRDEIVRWLPELAAVIETQPRKSGGPVDLADVRERRESVRRIG